MHFYLKIFGEKDFNQQIIKVIVAKKSKKKNKPKKKSNKKKFDLELTLIRYVPLGFGISWILLGIIDSIRFGFTYIEMLIGIVIVLSSLVSWKYYAIGGTLLMVQGVFAVFIIMNSTMLLLSKLVMIVTLSLPLMAPGILFLFRAKNINTKTIK